jgi:hypothetical protein
VNGAQFGLMRFDANGALDASFGNNGSVETGFGGQDYAYDMVLSADGGIVVGGSVNGHIAMAGYDADGRLKPSFASAGA